MNLVADHFSVEEVRARPCGGPLQRGGGGGAALTALTAPTYCTDSTHSTHCTHCTHCIRRVAQVEELLRHLLEIDSSEYLPSI